MSFLKRLALAKHRLQLTATKIPQNQIMYTISIYNFLIHVHLNYFAEASD